MDGVAPRAVSNSTSQSEAEVLTGVAVHDVASARIAARRLRDLGAKAVVLKLGELGAFVLDEAGQEELIPARAASVVDTTAAGDAFTAGLAVALAEGSSLPDAARFGCAVGTLACTKFGAQQTMPSRADVTQWLVSPN